MSNLQHGPVRAVPKKQFQLLLIKPSHYDDDGYVIRWWRGFIPSNSLAAVYGIAADCAERQVLGPDISIDIEAIDESCSRIDIAGLLAPISASRKFRACCSRRSPVEPVSACSRHRPAVPSGRHSGRDRRLPRVSGCMAMLDGHAVDLDACRDMGVSMFAGEAEGRFDGVLRDAANGRLATEYNFMDDLPGLEGTPVPFLPKRYVARTLGLSTSFDAGRGCPYQCSFCTIINVQGRKSRYRSADDVEQLVRIELGAWHQQVLRHRRQLRAKQGMGSHFRSSDRTARRTTASRLA